MEAFFIRHVDLFYLHILSVVFLTKKFDRNDMDCVSLYQTADK